MRIPQLTGDRMLAEQFRCPGGERTRNLRSRLFQRGLLGVANGIPGTSDGSRVQLGASSEQRLLRAAKIIALFSPEVSAMQEFERLKLTCHFAWRYQLARMSLKLGYSPLPALRDISDVVSGLSLRLDISINDLSERNAANLQFPSSS